MKEEEEEEVDAPTNAEQSTRDCVCAAQCAPREATPPSPHLTSTSTGCPTFTLLCLLSCFPTQTLDSSLRRVLFGAEALFTSILHVFYSARPLRTHVQTQRENLSRPLIGQAKAHHTHTKRRYKTEQREGAQEQSPLRLLLEGMDINAGGAAK